MSKWLRVARRKSKSANGLSLPVRILVGRLRWGQLNLRAASFSSFLIEPFRFPPIKLTSCLRLKAGPLQFMRPWEKLKINNMALPLHFTKFICSMKRGEVPLKLFIASSRKFLDAFVIYFEGQDE